MTTHQTVTTIVNYGTGNIGSIANMLKHVGALTSIASSPGEIEKAEKLILPGVGSFDAAMRRLDELGMLPILHEKVTGLKTPILGICLGMQLCTEQSEEGALPGLGWIKAKTVRFRFNGGPRELRIPHMGWNSVKIRKASPLFGGTSEELRFYFLHSYHVVCTNEADILTTTTHGYDFVSSFSRDNIIGVQFHPEKSHRFGMELLRNFTTC